MGTRREVSFFFILCFFMSYDRREAEMSVSALRRPIEGATENGKEEENSSRTELAENGGQCVRNELRIVIKEKKTSGGKEKVSEKRMNR